MQCQKTGMQKDKQWSWTNYPETFDLVTRTNPTNKRDVPKCSGTVSSSCSSSDNHRHTFGGGKNERLLSDPASVIYIDCTDSFHFPLTCKCYKVLILTIIFYQILSKELISSWWIVSSFQEKHFVPEICHQ